MPSGSGLTARCLTSPGSSWFRALCLTPASCHQRGHCCAPQDILGSRSHSPLGPRRSPVMSACRYRQGSCRGRQVVLWHRGDRPDGPSAQVVRVGSRELPALLREPEAAASPLLCLSQSGPLSFLRPVTVQLPLPPGITGERQCTAYPDSWPPGGGAAFRRGGLSLRPPPAPRPEPGPLLPAPAAPGPARTHLG